MSRLPGVALHLLMAAAACCLVLNAVATADTVPLAAGSGSPVDFYEARQTPERAAAFWAFARSEATYLHAGIILGDSNVGGRAMRMDPTDRTAHIRPGELFLCFPANLTLSGKAIGGDLLLASGAAVPSDLAAEIRAQAAQVTPAASDFALSAIAVLLVEQNPESYWRPYVDFIPSLSEATFPAYFGDAALARLEQCCRNEFVGLRAYRDLIVNGFDGLEAGLFRRHPDVFHPRVFTLDGWKWAMAAVTMRAFAPHAQMRPVHDILNHHAQLSVVPYVPYSQDESHAVSLFWPQDPEHQNCVLSVHDAGPGDELYTLYEFPLTTYQTFTRYGFVPDLVELVRVQAPMSVFEVPRPLDGGDVPGEEDPRVSVLRLVLGVPSIKTQTHTNGAGEPSAWLMRVLRATSSTREEAQASVGLAQAMSPPGEPLVPDALWSVLDGPVSVPSELRALRRLLATLRATRAGLVAGSGSVAGAGMSSTEARLIAAYVAVTLKAVDNGVDWAVRALVSFVMAYPGLVLALDNAGT